MRPTKNGNGGVHKLSVFALLIIRAVVSVFLLQNPVIWLDGILLLVVQSAEIAFIALFLA